jgi:predicted DNA-binding transcriptional regulator AlpA
MDLPTHASSNIRRARRRPEYVLDDPLLTAAEAAAERGQAISTFWRDVRAGRVPLAYRVSPRCPRWRRSELRESLEASRADVTPIDRRLSRATSAREG